MNEGKARIDPGQVQDLPEKLVLPAGKPRPLYPPVEDLVLRRDHSAKGVVYRAKVDHWFINGLPGHAKKDS